MSIKRGSCTDSPTDNVGQLIREVDQAFKVVGIALADVKASSSDWYDSNLTVPVVPRTGLNASQSRSPISRPKSVVKSKRKESHRRKTKQVITDGPKSTQISNNKPARWTLTDVTTNVVDIFNRKAFRTEVDEMLTPDRIQQIKDDVNRVEIERDLMLLSKSSLDQEKGVRLSSSHLEGLLLSSPRTTLSKSPEDKAPDEAIANPFELPFTEKGTESEALNILSPSKSADHTARRPLTLPTIPENSPEFSPPQDSSPSKRNRRPQESRDPFPGYLSLPSTNFTLTSRLFSHGPIRIEHDPQRRRNSLPEGIWDWTVFQIAISGTTSDYDDNDNDVQENQDELDVNDIIEWFATFEFESAGRLIHQRPMRELSKAYLSDFSSPETPWMDDYDEDSAKRLKREKKNPAFVPSAPISSKDELDEVIPMGFNLKHDLGAFLNWEASAYADHFR